MFCSKCGKENTDDSKFCSYCGAKIELAEPIAPIPVVEAEKNAPIPEAAPEPIQPPMQPVIPMNEPPIQPPMQPVIPMNEPPIQPPMQPKKKGNIAAKVVIILIVMLILGALGFLGYRMITKNAQNKAIQAKVELADEYLSDRDYERAIAIYQEVLDEAPDNDDAITGLTNTYIRWADKMVADGDYDGAIALLENADSRAKKAMIADALEDAKMAKEAYEEELRLAEEERRRKEEEERQRAEEEASREAHRLLQEYADREVVPNLLDTNISYTAPYIWTDLNYSANTYVRENDEANPLRVFDYADVLTDEEEQNLADRIAQIETLIGCDVVLVSINQSVYELFGDTGEPTDEAWENYMMLVADMLYEENAYGFDAPLGDGVLLLDNWYPGEEGLYLTAYGKLSKVYNTENISTILQTVNERMASNPYKAYVTYIEDAFVKGLLADENAYVNYGYVQDVDGVANYDIRDYDGDGQDEMLVLLNKWDEDSGLFFSSSTWLQMYEVIDGQVVLVYEHVLMNNILGGGDAEIDGVYVKESAGIVYIAADMQKAWTFLADGVYMAMGLWYYDGSEVRSLFADNVVGSDLYGDESFEEMADHLQEFGFTASAAYVGDGSYYNFDYDVEGDDMEVLFFLYGINEYAADYDSYTETEDYELWNVYGDPAGLGAVTYQIER